MKLKDMIYCALCSVLIIIGGLLHISIGPIPFTLQVLMLMLIVVLLETKAWISIAIYLLMGLIGLPVFSNGGGVGYILMPSFGFLLGFLAASIIGGYLFHIVEHKTIFTSFTIGILMELTIYLIALPYAFFILTKINGISLTVSTLFSSYFFVFLPNDLFSILLVSLFTTKIKKTIRSKLL